MTDTCITCRHFEKTNQGNGLCFRHPPVPLMLGVGRDAIGREGADIRSLRPAVAANDRACGEFFALMNAMPILGQHKMRAGSASETQ